MPEKKNKHMDIHDRSRIQRGLEDQESFASMGRAIGVSTSTISREVRTNRKWSVPKGKRWNLCEHKADCRKVNVCGTCEIATCRSCARVRCWEVCPDLQERKCDRLSHAPFVCGDCHRRFNCGFRHADYSAVDAQLSYEMRLVETREGLSLTPEQLQSVVTTVKRCLMRGWSVDAIWSVFGRSMPICERTMYNYIESGLMGLANIDLPMKVRYKPRRKVAEYRKMERDGRVFDDYMELPADMRGRAVQMDTVIGRVGDFKCILTLHFPAQQFQIMILLDDHTCEAVVGALDWIEGIVGTAEFARLFGIILTDRGTEFCDFEAIEHSSIGQGRRCRLFYCNPLASGQKGSCEKNHTLIRRILPKGTSFEHLTQYEVSDVCSRVNGYPRKSLGGKSPYAAAARLIPKKLLDELGISRLRQDEVNLKPDHLD